MGKPSQSIGDRDKFDAIREIARPKESGGPQPSMWRRPKVRRILAASVAVAGIALGAIATVAMTRDWLHYQNWGWVGWIVAATLLGLGMDGVWRGWERDRRWSRREWLLVTGLVGVALLYRLASLVIFPGSAHITGIEELEAGNWGAGYLRTGQSRWEFIETIRLCALAMWVWGPSLPAIRVVMSVVSALTTVALFAWLRAAVGMVGASIGAALFACSFWAVVYARLTHGLGTSGALFTAIAFALLAGPVRRGRPSGFVWLGVCAGEILYEYIAYRPLVLCAVIGAVASGKWWRRSLLTILVIAAMSAPLVAQFQHGGSWGAFVDGWQRARVQAPYYDAQASWKDTIIKRLDRARAAVELFYRAGDDDQTRNVASRPLVDPVTATLLLLGVVYALMHLGIATLALGALVVGLTGTLIATGNWDVGRASVVIVYVYALAGYGAAGLVTAVRRVWAGGRYTVVAAALTVCVGVAGVVNARDLYAYVTSPVVRRWQFFSLPFFSVWLRTHTRPGEQVIAIVSPDIVDVLAVGGGAWLRNTPAGRAFTDPNLAIAAWRATNEPTLFAVYVAPHVYRTGASPPFSWEMMEQVFALAPELTQLPWDWTYPPDDCPGVLFWTRKPS